MKTKAIFLIISFSLLFGFITQAQKLSYGVSGGVDLVGVYIPGKFAVQNNTYPYDNIITYNINGYFAYKSKGIFGVSIEPGFMIKGAKNELHEALWGDELIKIRDSYLQLPVLINFHISDRFYFSSGFEFAYMIKYYSLQANNTELHTLPKQRFQLSGMVGINYEVMKNIDIALRLNHELPYYREFDVFFMYYAQFLVRYKLNKTLADKITK